MSARELEDFIKVIETAEKLSKPSRPESSIWSSPTDIFTASPRKITPRPSAPPEVPKLWDPTSGNDFLGSSWGSSCKSRTGTATSVPSSSSTTTATLKKSATSQATTIRTATPSSGKTSVKEATVIEAKTLKNVDLFMNMQRHNRFARKQAKDLLSSISPSHSPRPPRKKSESPMARKPVTPKDTGSSRSPSSRRPPTTLSSSRISSMSPMKSDSIETIKSNKNESLSASSRKKSTSSGSSLDSSPKKAPSPSSSVKDAKTEVSTTRGRALARSVKIVDEDHGDEGEQEPRPLPKPRTKVEVKPPSKSRPKSAPTPKKKAAPPPPPKPEPLVDLRSYSKSLKLLGLDIPSNRTEATKVDTNTLEIRTKSPTMKTRITERTQSVNDLRQIVDSKHHMPKDQYGKIKSSLANAVFEEWYFNKMKELAEKKNAEMEKIESKIYQNEMDEVDKKEKAAIEYKNWLERKQKQFKKMARRQKKKEEIIAEDQEALKAKILKAEEEWREKKATEHKKKLKLKRRLQKNEELEKAEHVKKKEETVKHFMNWEQGWREKLKAKMIENKQKRLEELEVKKANAKAKREDAEAAFNAWKNKKDEERTGTSKKSGQQQKVSRKGLATASAASTGLEKEKKLEAAKEAYENWLEYIEQREQEEKFAEEERLLREMWRPPWYPAGIADY